MQKRNSLKNQIYENIYGDIISGVYPAGAILNEKMLTEKYAASKTPVREALVQFCSEGILQNLPRVGYLVTAISPGEIHEICDLRIILEMAALERTWKQLSEEQLQALEQYVKQAKQIDGEKDVRRHWQANLDFHLFLCSLCGNAFIYRSLEQALKFCSRGAAQFFNDKWAHDQATDEHAALVAAMRAGDRKNANEILYRDIYAMKNQWLGLE